MDKNTHVYCTLCKNGEELIAGFAEDTETSIPKPCEECFPWNPEDSFRYEERPNYTPKE